MCWGGLTAYLEQRRACTVVCCEAAGIGKTTSRRRTRMHLEDEEGERGRETACGWKSKRAGELRTIYYKTMRTPRLVSFQELYTPSSMQATQYVNGMTTKEMKRMNEKFADDCPIFPYTLTPISRMNPEDSQDLPEAEMTGLTLVAR